jgi:hypothetical protein
MEAPEGLCSTCRWVASRFHVYPAGVATVSFHCQINAAPWPRMHVCQKYEREPGADDEPVE